MPKKYNNLIKTVNNLLIVIIIIMLMMIIIIIPDIFVLIPTQNSIINYLLNKKITGQINARHKRNILEFIGYVI